MDDSLDELDKEAQQRSGRGRGRTAGESRNPRSRKPQGDDDAARRRAERDREREQRRDREEAEREDPPDTGSEADRQSPPPQDEEVGEQGAGRRRTRPKSIPFYPNPDHAAFLWRVTEAASARQKRIPSTAVLRLALTRLEEQMTPGEIVKILGESVQPEGKMGRPRL